MRAELGAEVEACRVDGQGWRGPYGKFKLVCPETGRRLVVVASDGRDWGEDQGPFVEAEWAHLPAAMREHVRRVWVAGALPPPAWEHVSVSSPFGCPTWAEMAWVKGVFWGPEECVVQFHPPESEYVNLTRTCLHLWRAVGVEFPRPPLVTV